MVNRLLDELNILFRNNGNGTFTDVTETAGVNGTLDKMGLVVIAFDYNNDLWPDIYIGNDMDVGNIFYENNGDGTFVGGFGWSIQGGPTDKYAAVNNGTATPDDTDYVVSYISEGSGGDYGYFLFEDMPADFDAATSATVKIRQLCYTNEDSVKYQLFESNESTALTNEITLECDNSEIAHTSPHTFRTDTVSFTITGATTKTAWDGARLKIIHVGTGDGDDPLYHLSEIDLEMDYDTAGGGGDPSSSSWFESRTCSESSSSWSESTWDDRWTSSSSWFVAGDDGTDCLQVTPYAFAAGQDCIDGLCDSSNSSLTVNCECCCCGKVLYANSPFGDAWNNNWLLEPSTQVCTSGGTTTAPTYRAAPGTEVYVCCDCAQSSSSSASLSSSSSSSSSSSPSSSSSSSSSSLSESIESCSDSGHDACADRGYAGVIAPWDGTEPGHPYTPAYGSSIGTCGPCWNFCKDGYVPPTLEVLHSPKGALINPLPPAGADLCQERTAGGALIPADLPVGPGWQEVAWHCCEDPLPAQSEASSDSLLGCEDNGWALWWTFRPTDGDYTNQRWYPVLDQVRAAGFQPNQCAAGEVSQTPARGARPNFVPTPAGFGTGQPVIPGGHPVGFGSDVVFRKECCGYNDTEIPDFINNSVDTTGDYSGSCNNKGWAYWYNVGGALPDCENSLNVNMWALFASHAQSGFGDVNPCDADPGIIDMGGFGIDNIIVVTCCVLLPI